MEIKSVGIPIACVITHKKANNNNKKKNEKINWFERENKYNVG